MIINTLISLYYEDNKIKLTVFFNNKTLKLDWLANRGYAIKI